MKKLLLSLSFVLGFNGVSHAGVQSVLAVITPSVVISSASAAANTQAQILITTGTTNSPFSAGLYNYVSHIHIEMYPTATLVGAGGPVYCTSVGLSGNPKFGFSTNITSGTMVVTDVPYDNPIQGAQAANTTITCPATTSIIWNMSANYFQTQ